MVAHGEPTSSVSLAGVEMVGKAGIKVNYVNKTSSGLQLRYATSAATMNLWYKIGDAIHDVQS